MDIRALGTASARRGIGAYIRGLLAGLASVLDAGTDEIIAFSHRRDGDLQIPDALRHERLSRPRRATTLWDQFAWPPLLRRRGIHVFHSTFYAVPLLRGCRVVQSIHDLSPLRRPDLVSRRNSLIFRINFALARTADRILVPSEFTRGDVMDYLGLPSERIMVIPYASDLTVAEAELHRHRSVAVPRPYLLHSGGHDPIKNIPVILEALRELDLSLVVAGEHGPNTEALRERARSLGVDGRVIFPGYLPREDLIALYCGATAVVYPSLNEGFGLPVLEAMICGAPVVTARSGSIPEVGGEACLYVDPNDAKAIAAAVERLLTEPTLAQELIDQGRHQAARFSWVETARRTLAVFRDLAGHS